LENQVILTRPGLFGKQEMLSGFSKRPTHFNSPGFVNQCRGFILTGCLKASLAESKQPLCLLKKLLDLLPEIFRFGQFDAGRGVSLCFADHVGVVSRVASFFICG
jgi:hypothetical protein